MKYYLSSFKLGNEVEKLKRLIPPNKRTAYITNALDMADGQPWVKEFTDVDVAELSSVGLEVEHFDLRNYFDNQPQLEHDLRKYGIIWVSGGNVFVLRQAMQLSGFDDVIKNLAHEGDLLYGGYSAGICVLAPSLRGLELVDSTTNTPYGDKVGVVWEGLGLLPYVIVPHFNSDHPESKAINDVVAYAEKHGIEYKTIKDGEVIVIE